MRTGTLQLMACRNVALPRQRFVVLVHLVYRRLHKDQDVDVLKQRLGETSIGTVISRTEGLLVHEQS